MKLTDLLYKKDDGIAYITINRPENFNSFRLQTFDELLMIIDDLDNDNTIGVVVIQGAGNKAFCSGVDVETLKGMSEFPEHLIRKFTKKAIQMVNGLLLLDKPTIAAVKGYSIGFGHELHMLCDLTIAADNAIFGQVGPKVASVPMVGGTQILPFLVGIKKAKEILFLCKQYTAKQALEMGLVNAVCPLDQLDEEVYNVCQTILDMSPSAIRLAKLSLNHDLFLKFPSFTDGAELWSGILAGKEEMREGTRAFFSKQKPDFRKFRR